ncbi:MAG: hypothetical protein ACI8RD_002818 [Bacillariaceae sp.]|jgi:hypothetical protein
MALPSSIVLLEGRPYFFSLKKNLAIFFLFRGILVPVFLHGTGEPAIGETNKRVVRD